MIQWQCSINIFHRTKKISISWQEVSTVGFLYDNWQVYMFLLYYDVINEDDFDIWNEKPLNTETMKY